MILVGDIGGTKTDLAIFSVDKGPENRWRSNCTRASVIRRWRQ